MTCWAITQTHRFKAAVAENPVSDLFTEYGVNDIDPWASPDEYEGQPHEAWDVYWNESPIAHAHQCKTPTLLLQGESDYRCPAGQSEEFYTYLKVNGCVVEMVRLPESSHAATIIGNPMIRRVGNEVLLDWMDRFILGKTNSERKPSC
jgi:dipeptidyl aminopeptidase/acylaminoacyl peptidase